MFLFCALPWKLDCIFRFGALTRELDGEAFLELLPGCAEPNEEEDLLPDCAEPPNELLDGAEPPNELLDCAEPPNELPDCAEPN